MCSGRMPKEMLFAPFGELRGKGSLIPPPSWTVRSTHSPEKKFIGGVPMKPATNRLVGLSYASSGVATSCQLTITVGLIADLKVINPFDFFIEDGVEIWQPAGLTYPKALADDLKPYLRPVDEEGEGSG